MANCENLFRKYIGIVTPTSEQLEKMRISRVALENKIISKFEEKRLPKPSFYTQGSSSKNMCTRVIKADGTYDVDRGVYLPDRPDVSAETIKRYIYEAVKSHTDDGASNKQKCVRVFFKGDYDVDFTAYYEVDNESYSYLAVNGKGWIKDDPSKMIEWFVEKKAGNNQLIRVVKYLKAWASEFKSFKMPSGIALTVWAASNFKAVEDRDDKALLGMIKPYLKR